LISLQTLSHWASTFAAAVWKLVAACENAYRLACASEVVVFKPLQP
jgi:hypothetical protein